MFCFRHPPPFSSSTNQVAYREAITRPAEVDYTHKKQSGGSGQFARVKIKFEPASMDEDGATSDFVFESEIKGGVVPKEYIPGVQKARDILWRRDGEGGRGDEAE